MPEHPCSSSAEPSTNSSRDTILHAPRQEAPLWTDLYENIRDALLPQKLPPLELTSTPIPVLDRMAVRTNPWAVGTSTLLNGAVAAMLLWMGLHAVTSNDSKGPLLSRSHISDLNFLVPRFGPSSNGSNGGGQNDPVDPIKGRLPKFAQNPLTPPQVPVLDNPKLRIDPTLALPDVKLPDNPNLPNIGVHDSVNVSLLSNGPGTHVGIGTGDRGGVGPHNGSGWGPGDGPGLYSPGGDVSEPVALFTPEAEFSDEARRAKYQGVCMISIIVDTRGNAVNPRILRTLGMGLDEKALAAVSRYRFKPAMRHGQPVPVRITVAVDFRLL